MSRSIAVERECQHGQKILSSVQGLWLARAGAGRHGHDRPRRASKHHDHVVATMLEFEPPLVGCVISNRNYSFSLLQATNECVLNIPTLEIAEKVVGCGNTSGAKIDKFERFGLTPKPAALVGAPLIEECFVNLECRVVDTGMVAKYCLFVLEVVKAWIDPAVKNPRTIHHCGNGNFMVVGEKIRLKSKMK